MNSGRINNLTTNLTKHITLKAVFTSFIPIMLGILVMLLYDINKSVDDLSVSFIKETSVEVKDIVQNYIDDINRLVLSTSDLNYNNTEDILNYKENNKHFGPILTYLETVTSIVVASTDGSSYMLHKTDGGWMNRLIYNKNNQFKRLKLSWKDGFINDENLESSSNDSLFYSACQRPWFKGAITQKPNEVFWTKPYLFYYRQKYGITASTYSITDNGDTIVTAYDILLKDFNKISKSIELTPNSYAFIVTASNLNLIGFPDKEQFDEEDSIKKYILGSAKDLGIESLNKGISHWIKHNRIKEPFELEVGNKDWWIGFQPVFSEGEEKLFYVVMIVPESDFRSNMNRTINIIIISFIIILTLLFFSIRAYRRIQTQNELLNKKRIRIAQQKKSIEVKNKEIMDSIYYSKKIQTSMLPSKNEIQSSFKDSFVLYLPKDIVSGDFYWINKFDDYQMMAAVDCTGHGVPGAILSMVAYGGLKSAVIEQKMVNPKDIFNQLQGVINSFFLNSNNEHINDGMDMALCVYNKKTSLLQYSGAKNPLYIVRNTSKLLIVDDVEQDAVLKEKDRALYVVKADRKGIEPTLTPIQYTCHDIKVEKGDIVYLFTDGYADQFGGDKGKKLNQKRFKDLIFSISKKGSLCNQDKVLQEFYMNWKGSEEQVDDVLVMGFRV